MTPEEQMRAIQEDAGECRHEWANGVTGHNTANHRKVHKCKICGKSGDGHVHLGWLNPSPADLNELFRLAEKLGCKEYGTAKFGGKFCAGVELCEASIATEEADTPADALREALYLAVKGEV